MEGSPTLEVVEAPLDAEGSLRNGPLPLPEALPVLPLRDSVAFPDTITPLAVGQPRSIKLVDDAREALPHAGWQIRSRDNASPQLERTINRFTQFLTLVGLAALLPGLHRRIGRSSVYLCSSNCSITSGSASYGIAVSGSSLRTSRCARMPLMVEPSR